MATKFSSIYKQELKSKGALSSMGSAVLKSARERTDIRNILFGGKGMISTTGQKIFGEGYSALSSGSALSAGSTGGTSAAQAAAQSAATGELISSNERQEALLRVVAKNTFNMNMMARDMNVTRQNIATMTKLAAGKASQSQDSLWYDVKTRNQSIDSLGKKSPTKEGGNKQSSGAGIFGLLGGLFSGGANLLGAVVSGLLGTVGTIGGGILSAIATVMRVVPNGFLLGTIALAGVAYLLKKVSENIKFSALKDDILKGLGLDPEDKENSLTKQILVKLGFSTETAGKIDGIFSDIGTAVADAFRPAVESFKEIFAPVVRTMLIHSKAAFNTLAHSFSILGEELRYQADKLFNENRGKIFAAIALGYMGPAVLLAPKLGAAIAALAAGFGYMTSEKTIPEMEADLKDQEGIVKKGLSGLTGIRGRPKKTLEEIMEGYNKPGGRDTNFFGRSYNPGGLTNEELGIADAETKRIEIAAALEEKRQREEASKRRQEQLKDIPKSMRESYQQEVERETGIYAADAALENKTKPSSTAPTQLKKGQKISGFEVTSLFGKRTDPITGREEDHQGIDIAMPKGTPLHAVVDGKIVAVDNNPIAGKYVILQDANGTQYSYSHLDSSDVIKGQEVKRGNLIGKSGNTGRSTGPHLHFGVKEKGNYRSPLLEELQNAVTQAKKVSSLSIENMDQQRASMFSGSGGETTVNIVSNNYSGGRGDSQQLASSVDYSAIELFASRQA
jgi:murein DD-endopeptidase MepM/ murein hydrolase activator NlpD